MNPFFSTAFAVVSFASCAIAAAASLSNASSTAGPVAPDDGRLSWQSAFWAVVSIALCAAAEPSGRILDMPSEWGFALKCSPVICVFNAIEALACIRLQWQPVCRLSVRSAKYSSRRSETDVPPSRTALLEHNSVFRLACFVLGPLLQATKLFACSGILYTKLLAGCYLASFICDELVLNLISLTRSDNPRLDAPGLVASTLSMFGHHSKEQEETTTQPSSPEDTRRPSQAGPTVANFTAMVASAFFISWFACVVLFIFRFREPEVFRWLGALAFPSTLLYGIDAVARKFRYEGFVPAFVRGGVSEALNPHLLIMLIQHVLDEGASVLSVSPAGALRLYYGDITTVKWLSLAGASLVIACHIVSAWINCLKKRESVDANPGEAVSHEFRKMYLGVWGSMHFLTALLMYCFTFDSDQTTKPSWTGVLG